MVPDLMIAEEPVGVPVRVCADIVRAPGPGTIRARTLDGTAELYFRSAAAVVVMWCYYVL